MLPVLDILSRHLNGMLADAKIDPAKALADADREAQAKVAEIRKKWLSARPGAPRGPGQGPAAIAFRSP